MSEKFELQSVAGRWCERSINCMEQSALVYITNEVHAISGDMGLVALLSDYVRMGREYGDMMNSDAKNMKERIAELEDALKIASAYINPHEPCIDCKDEPCFEKCESYHDIQRDVEKVEKALKGTGK